MTLSTSIKTADRFVGSTGLMPKPHFPFVRPRPYPNSFVIAVQLRAAPTNQQRRDFFVSMHSEARHHGLVMGSKLGLCVFLGAERLCTNASRHQMINWLADHSEVSTIVVSRLKGFATLFRADGPVPRALAAARHDNPDALRVAVRRVAWGTAKQWLAHVQGGL
jgi:hypothetical protein